MVLSMIAAMMFCNAMNVQAQEEAQNEVSVSYGGAGASTIGDGFGKIGTAFITLGSVSTKNEKEFGPLAVEYFHKVAPKLSVGVIGTWVRVTGDEYFGSEKHGDYTKNIYSILPAVKYQWLKKKNFGMYSKVGLGITFCNSKETVQSDNRSESSNETKFGFQVSAVGIEVGSSICGFAEVGYGEQGMLLAGLRVKF